MDRRRLAILVSLFMSWAAAPHAQPASRGGSTNHVPATISGQLTDGAGKPTPGGDVQLMQGTQKIASARTGADGSYFLLVKASEEPHRLTATFENSEAASAEAPLASGPNRIDLKLRDTLRISGTVLGPDGQPRPGVKVEAVRAEDGTVAGFAVSDVKGAFALRRLPDGNYKLRGATALGSVAFEDGKVLTVSVDAPATRMVITLPAIAAPGNAVLPTNQVLRLDGSGAHLELPAGMFGNLRQTTIEAWARFATIDGLQRFFSYGRPGSDLYLGREQGLPGLFFGTFHPLTANDAARGTAGHKVGASEVLEEGRWCHVAVVIDSRETRLYFNGTLAGIVPGSSSFTELAADSPSHIGYWGYAGDGFNGEIDEVRIWAVPRTIDAIRATMFQRLTGREEGLAALWNFDAPTQPGKDATPNGFNGQLRQDFVSQANPHFSH